MALGIFIGMALYGALDVAFGLGDTLRAEPKYNQPTARRPDMEVISSYGTVSQTYITPDYNITINPN